ncbi:hypothetical protein UlMin_024240 [Ulmus minor]
MLCSEPAGKSGPNWLDRLRSNKGFPTGDDHDLDHFLTQNPNPSSSESTPPEASGRLANRTENPRRSGEWFGVMSNVLSELFFMGGSDESSRLSGKRIPRKQTNPRICVISSGNNTDSSNTSVLEQKKVESLNSDSNSLMEIKGGNVRRRVVDVDIDDEEEDRVEEQEEEEKGEKELKGYSRSEVTVIDTSCGLWKSEKLVFRRKNVWKVREKKSKLRNFGKKKRKGSDSSWGIAVGERKKSKLLASREANGDQCSKPSSDENLKNNSREEVCKSTADTLNAARAVVSTDSRNKLISEVFKRSHLSIPPRKMKKGSSSVVLIKGGINPTGKKITAKLSKKCDRGTQKQHKA